VLCCGVVWVGEMAVVEVLVEVYEVYHWCLLVGMHVMDSWALS
jgi:hypothetical protein